MNFISFFIVNKIHVLQGVAWILIKAPTVQLKFQNCNSNRSKSYAK